VKLKQACVTRLFQFTRNETKQYFIGNRIAFEMPGLRLVNFGGRFRPKLRYLGVIMNNETNPQKLPLEDLAQRCAEETEHYFRHQNNDSQWCFELFRRAIRVSDQSAWELICDQYQPLVTGWVRQHPGFDATGEDIQYFVNGAFGKISVSLTPDKFGRFSDIRSLLSYLKMCVHSVIVDYNRLAEEAPLYDLDDISSEPSTDPLVEVQTLDEEYQREFWDWVKSRLHDEKEQLVVYGLYILGFKPRELYEKFHTKFDSVDDIYRTIQNVLARLRRDSDAPKFLNTND